MKNFDSDYFKNEILPVLKKYEPERIKSLIIFLVVSIIFIAINYVLYSRSGYINFSNTRILFEIGNIFLPLANKKQIDKFYKEISAIYELIDYFKLTEKIGL